MLKKLLAGLILCGCLLPFFYTQGMARDTGVDKKTFDACVRLLRDPFAQKKVQAGKDGIKVTCTIMPRKETTAAAWEIKNPRYKLFTIRSEDIKLYSGKDEYMKLNPERVADIMYRWNRPMGGFSQTQQAFLDLNISSGEESEKDLIIKAAFQFGETDDTAIYGMTYFNCILKETKGVTTEIKIDDNIFSFDFEGEGP